MFCSIESLTYNYEHPQTVRQLNLSSTSHIKIHCIRNLQNFLRLRSLNLSNNMIIKMEGLQNLTNLRVLNLQFNQIKILEGTQNLTQLQELFLSYNEIQYVSDSLKQNVKLKVLHLAYNDIRCLDNISILYEPFSKSTSERIQLLGGGFPQLSTLSLYGNPLVSAINYRSFFKMLIPTLRSIDDRDVTDNQISSNVCPQQQIAILRQALNKLLEQRNAAIDQLQSYVDAPTAKVTHPKQDKSKKKQLNSCHRESIKFKLELLHFLQGSKEKYLNCVQQIKQSSTKLTKLYSENLKKIKIQKQLSSIQISDENNVGQAMQEAQVQQCQKRRINKQILAQLKQFEEKQLKFENMLTNINNIINLISHHENTQDILTTILQSVLFGFQFKGKLTVYQCYKLCKKYLIKQNSQSSNREQSVQYGLIQSSQILKQIIYGSSNDRSKFKIQSSSILQLKDKLKGKGLIQIITELKQQNQQLKMKNLNFDKQRKLFIQKFERQTQQLTKSWDELIEEKGKIQLNTEKQLLQLGKKQVEMKRKYRIVQQEEKQKIIELKKARDKLEVELNRAKQKLGQTEETLNRRFLQLEQFQNHFNQFIQEKQHMKSLEYQIEEITSSVAQQQEKYSILQNKVKQLILQEGIYMNKIYHAQDQIRIKEKQLFEIQNKSFQIQKNSDKIKSDLQYRIQKLQNISNEIKIKQEQFKDFQKMSERAKKNYGLLQQKMKNIEYIQNNKRLIIKQLQEQMKSLKQEKQKLIQQIENLDKNYEIKRSQLLICQRKIQENKYEIENLSNINKNVSDMMLRQMELKRNIIQLEIENKNLMEMKNNLLQQFKLKQYL